MGGAGFEPAKAMPPDLQSGPFSHLGNHPLEVLGQTGLRELRAFRMIESCEANHSFRRAGGESRTRNLRFTKPLLCQLSYASIAARGRSPGP